MSCSPIPRFQVSDFSIWMLNISSKHPVLRRILFSERVKLSGTGHLSHWRGSTEKLAELTLGVMGCIWQAPDEFAVAVGLESKVLPVKKGKLGRKAARRRARRFPRAPQDLSITSQNLLSTMDLRSEWQPPHFQVPDLPQLHCWHLWPIPYKDEEFWEM